MPTKTPRERRYWDACRFIAIINKEAGRLAMCASILKEAQKPDPRIEIVSSIITIAEVVRPQGCAGLTPQQEAEIDAFFDNDWLIPVNADRHIMEEARQLERAHGLKVRDAIHIASAIFAGAVVVETYDGPLLGLDGRIPVPGTVAPLSIREPFFPPASQPGLFAT